MCLIIQTTDTVKIAKKDIICYKLIEEYFDNNYRTFYQDVVIRLGKTYRSKIDRQKGSTCDSIEKGLHSFKTKAGAFQLYKKASSFNHTVHIVKCIIPMGSKYYTGRFADSCAYASNWIVYGEIVYTYKTR